MDSTTFLPTYDPALLEPIASPSLTENSIPHIKSEHDFLFPPSAYEDSLSSFHSASQSPSYSPKCSSVDSEIYFDMDRKSSCVTPENGIGMLSSGENYQRQSWNSDMNGASYHQHPHSLGYTYSPSMQHQQPPSMMNSRDVLVMPTDNSFWQSNAQPSFYQSHTPAWSQPASITSDDSYRMSLSNITHRRESLASPAKPRSMRDSKRKSGSSPSLAGRAAPYARRSKMLTPERNESTNSWDCVHCQQAFRDLASLDKHIKAEHTRPLICVFHWAGCTSRFASKNEWKRHVFSQHLALKYWICTEGSCGEARNALATRRRSSSLPAVGCIFNRKDLYTQHVRRMHLQPDAKRGTKKYRDMDSAASDDFVRDAQTRAARTRCELPTFMSCPAEGCDLEFHGPTAWDDRMEHVASHLERAAAGEEPTMAFGGLDDWTLTGWAEQANVEVVRRSADGWVLCNPLKSDGTNTGSSNGVERRAPRAPATVAPAAPAEDAEGEDQYNLWPNNNSHANGLTAPAASTTA